MQLLLLLLSALFGFISAQIWEPDTGASWYRLNATGFDARSGCLGEGMPDLDDHTPAKLVSPAPGILLSISERVSCSNPSECSPYDLAYYSVLRRSTDSGKTWTCQTGLSAGLVARSQSAIVVFSQAECNLVCIVGGNEPLGGGGARQLMSLHNTTTTKNNDNSDHTKHQHHHPPPRRTLVATSSKGRVDCSSDAGVSWSQHADAPPPIRLATSFQVKDSIWLIGGVRTDSSELFADRIHYRAVLSSPSASTCRITSWVTEDTTVPLPSPSPFSSPSASPIPFPNGTQGEGGETSEPSINNNNNKPCAALPSKYYTDMVAVTATRPSDNVTVVFITGGYHKSTLERSFQLWSSDDNLRTWKSEGKLPHYVTDPISLFDGAFVGAAASYHHALLLGPKNAAGQEQLLWLSRNITTGASQLWTRPVPDRGRNSTTTTTSTTPTPTTAADDWTLVSANVFPYQVTRTSLNDTGNYDSAPLLTIPTIMTIAKNVSSSSSSTTNSSTPPSWDDLKDVEKVLVGFSRRLDAGYLPGASAFLGGTKTHNYTADYAALHFEYNTSIPSRVPDITSVQQYLWRMHFRSCGNGSFTPNGTTCSYNQYLKGCTAGPDDGPKCTRCRIQCSLYEYEEVQCGGGLGLLAPIRAGNTTIYVGAANRTLVMQGYMPLSYDISCVQCRNMTCPLGTQPEYACNASSTEPAPCIMYDDSSNIDDDGHDPIVNPTPSPSVVPHGGGDVDDNTPRINALATSYMDPISRVSESAVVAAFLCSAIFLALFCGSWVASPKMAGGVCHLVVASSSSGVLYGASISTTTTTTSSPSSLQSNSNNSHSRSSSSSSTPAVTHNISNNNNNNNNNIALFKTGHMHCLFDGNEISSSSSISNRKPEYSPSSSSSPFSPKRRNVDTFACVFTSFFGTASRIWQVALIICLLSAEIDARLRIEGVVLSISLFMAFISSAAWVIFVLRWMLGKVLLVTREHELTALEAAASVRSTSSKIVLAGGGGGGIPVYGAGRGRIGNHNCLHQQQRIEVDDNEDELEVVENIIASGNGAPVDSTVSTTSGSTSKSFTSHSSFASITNSSSPQGISEISTSPTTALEVWSLGIFSFSMLAATFLHPAIVILQRRHNNPWFVGNASGGQKYNVNSSADVTSINRPYAFALVVTAMHDTIMMLVQFSIFYSISGRVLVWASSCVIYLTFVLSLIAWILSFRAVNMANGKRTNTRKNFHGIPTPSLHTGTGADSSSNNNNSIMITSTTSPNMGSVEDIVEFGSIRRPTRQGVNLQTNNNVSSNMFAGTRVKSTSSSSFLTTQTSLLDSDTNYNHHRIHATLSREREEGNNYATTAMNNNENQQITTNQTKNNLDTHDNLRVANPLKGVVIEQQQQQQPVSVTTGGLTYMPPGGPTSRTHPFQHLSISMSAPSHRPTSTFAALAALPVPPLHSSSSSILPGSSSVSLGSLSAEERAAQVQRQITEVMNLVQLTAVSAAAIAAAAAVAESSSSIASSSTSSGSEHDEEEEDVTAQAYQQHNQHPIDRDNEDVEVEDHPVQPL